MSLAHEVLRCAWLFYPFREECVWKEDGAWCDCARFALMANPYPEAQLVPLVLDGLMAKWCTSRPPGFEQTDEPLDQIAHGQGVVVAGQVSGVDLGFGLAA